MKINIYMYKKIVINIQFNFIQPIKNLKIKVSSSTCIGFCYQWFSSPVSTYAHSTIHCLEHNQKWRKCGEIDLFWVKTVLDFKKSWWHCCTCSLLNLNRTTLANKPFTLTLQYLIVAKWCRTWQQKESSFPHQHHPPLHNMFSLLVQKYISP